VGVVRSALFGERDLGWNELISQFLGGSNLMSGDPEIGRLEPDLGVPALMGGYRKACVFLLLERVGSGPLAAVIFVAL
jgi:hypothetical protein